jgi:lipopolysaccharide transport system ATP-binding protein
MRFLREFKKKGTIFFVSHDTQAIQSLCDRAALMESGRIKLIGDARSVSEVYLEEIYGQQQRVRQPDRGTARESFDETDGADVRKELIESSNLRNRIEVFRFDLSGPGFGAGGARIREVAILNREGEKLSSVNGDETVTLEVMVEALSDLSRPIVGFFVKDRLGQHLFGDNTYLTYLNSPVAVPAGTTFRARFQFRMPILPAGDYFVSPAVADGTQGEHVQHHWLHEAIRFRSVASHVAGGLVGLPMRRIELVIDTTLGDN